MIQARHVIWALAIAVFTAATTYGDPIELGFEYDANDVGIQAGQVIDDEFAAWGITISADNNRHWHPDQVIAFDSANPTGGDPDLATPGSGPGNNTALGMLLIIAEDVWDWNNDGFVDDPDDEAAGGTIRFMFDRIQNTSGSASFVDIEESGGRIELYNAGVFQNDYSIAGLGNNSMQTVDFGLNTFDEIRMVLKGSGAVGSMQFQSTNIPEPATIAMIGIGGLMLLPRWKKQAPRGE